MTLFHLHALRGWTPRRWAAASGGAVLAALAVGLPTAVVPNPWFARMLPVQWWNYPVLAMTATLGGLLLATYVRAEPNGSWPASQLDRDRSRAGVVGGVLSALAVGCPVCNKLVLVAVGVSGALNVWAPLQPFVGVASVALLGWALQRRLAGEVSCPAPARSSSAAEV